MRHAALLMRTALLAALGRGDARACVAADLPSLSGCTSLSLSDGELGKSEISSIGSGVELTSLEVHGSPLGSKGAAALAEALRPLQMLRELTLGSCRLGEQGAQLLLAGLPGSLETLDLRNNYLGDEAMREVSRVLEGSSPPLRMLNLSWNGIGVKGGRTLGEALLNNTVLEELSLSWNGLKDRGARALGEMLAHNGKLVRLDLEHNAIKDSGANSLAKGLRENGALQELRLSYNGVSDAVHSAVEAALQMTPQKKEDRPPPQPAPLYEEESEEVEEISFDDEEADEGSRPSARDEL